MKEVMPDVNPVSGTTGIFTIILFERNGTCHIKMESSSLWRPLQSKLILCAGRANPDKNKAVVWWQPQDCSRPSRDIILGDNVWDTGEPWGTNYSAAMIAEDMCGKYQIVIATNVTR